MPDPSLPIVFLAGLASFLSPCVLPLVPGYLSYMSGLGTRSEHRTVHPLSVALVFVAGFSAVFIALGASATLLGDFLGDNQSWFVRIGGLFIIVMGLAFMGVLRIPFLERDVRFHPQRPPGLLNSALLGGAFAFGWSPCIGPTMAVAMTMAAGRAPEGGAGQGALLLGVYSLGLGLPFIVAGTGVSRLTGFVGWFRRHARAVNLVSGGLLVVVGVLFVSDRLFQLSIWLQESFTAWGLDFWSAF